MTHKNEQKEYYLNFPYHILNLEQIGLCEKMLLAWIYSFGAKGCYQSNATLAKVLMVKERTVRRWIQKLVRANLVQIKCPKGYYRTIWAKSHPAVKEAAELYYRGRKIPNEICESDMAKNGQQPGQKWPSHMAKSGFRLGQKCPTTNNKTNTDTIENTTATPSPKPAGWQAQALLEDREKGNRAVIEKFKKDYGIGGKPRQRLTEKEFDDKKQKQLAALGAG
jgi:hypothetical protein